MSRRGISGKNVGYLLVLIKSKDVNILTEIEKEKNKE